MAKDQERKEKGRFFKDFKAELKKVIWPTPKQVVNNTVAVVTIVLITAIIVLVLDLTFDLFNSYGVDKLKEIVRKDEIVDNIEGNDIVEEDITEENQETSEEDANIVEETPSNEETQEQNVE